VATSHRLQLPTPSKSKSKISSTSASGIGTALGTLSCIESIVIVIATVGEILKAIEAY
jgi:hypothetical protein